MLRPDPEPANDQTTHVQNAHRHRDDAETHRTVAKALFADHQARIRAGDSVDSPAAKLLHQRIADHRQHAIVAATLAAAEATLAALAHGHDENGAYL